MSCTAPALLRVTMMLLTLIPLTWALIVLGGLWLIGQPVGPQVAAIGALVLLGLSSLATAAARPGWRSILAMSYFWGLSCGLVLLQLGGDARPGPARCVLLAVAMLPAAVGTLIELRAAVRPGEAVPALSPGRWAALGHGRPLAGIGLLGRLALLLPLWVASFAPFRGGEWTTLIGWREGTPDPNTHTRYHHHGLVLPWQECSFSWVVGYGEGSGRWAETSPSLSRLVGHATFQLFVLAAILLPRCRKGPWHKTARRLDEPGHAPRDTASEA